MLDLTRIQGGTMIPEIPLYPGIDVEESGLAMIRVADSAGNEAIRPAQGNAGELFIGVSYFDKHAAATGTRVAYPVLVPAAAPLSVVLPDAVGITNLMVVDSLGNIAPGADYNLAGNVLTFNNNAYAATHQFLSYNYTLTLAQKMNIGISPVPSAASFLGKLAVLSGTCRLYVTNFDASATFSVVGADSVVTLMDGGMFSLGGNVAIGNCIHVPTAADPFLGIEYTVVH
jgi:hypothetical protein